MRSDHANARQKKIRANRRGPRNAPIPVQISDRVHEGVAASDKLEYEWNDVRAESTSKRLRTRENDGDGRGRLQKDGGHTPHGAWRKMFEKVNRRTAQASRGEFQRIVARGEQTRNNYPVSKGGALVPISDTPPVRSATMPPWWGDDHASWVLRRPAQEQIQHPRVVGIPREAHEVLVTPHLHHRQDCPEQWPVFEAAWPNTGERCARRCQTTARDGYRCWHGRLGLCHRCDTSQPRCNMYCRLSLQHLGLRHPALAELNWFESLLIARVHPVIIIVSHQHTTNKPRVPTGNVTVFRSDTVDATEWVARAFSQPDSSKADLAGQPLLRMDVEPHPGPIFCERNRDEASLMPKPECADAGTFECELCLASLPREFLGFQCLGCGLKLCSRCWCYDVDRSKPCACGYLPNEAHMSSTAGGKQLRHPWVPAVRSTAEELFSASTHDCQDIDQQPIAGT
jgi:hypothetical protein